MFEAFPKLTRFSHGWTVTEKIDGTNSQIIITHQDNIKDSDPKAIAYDNGYYIHAGSRNRLIYPGNDNAGFAAFVSSNAGALIEALGEGRHFGEWWGSGIQRRYDMKEKRFSLFNVNRWQGPKDNGMLPPQVDVVPALLLNQYVGDTSKTFDDILEGLRIGGSHAAPGFMNPEGIVMFHYPSRTTFKKTFDYDEQGKWAEKQ